MITLHVIRRSLRPKGDGIRTRLGLDSQAFAERGHCALRSDDTDGDSLRIESTSISELRWSHLDHLEFLAVALPWRGRIAAL